jgi:hypothetical protein
MAGDLKARLGLATYKLKTNQTGIPFTQLEARQLVARPRNHGHSYYYYYYYHHQHQRRTVPTVQVHRPSSSSQPEQREDDVGGQSSQETVGRPDADARDPRVGLPAWKAAGALLTPRKEGERRDEERLSSSAIRGGAASGLLRLAQGVRS